MRICIVGAGIAGCHAAFDLAADHDVTVLDRVGIAAEATGYSAGLVAPTQYYPDRPAIARHANGFFADFDGSHGFEFTERDRLDVVTEAEAETVRSTADELADAGFPVDYLAADEIPDRYPRIRPDGFAGAVRYGDTGWVDPYTYATALKAAAEADGATFEVGVEVENVRLGRTDDHAARTDDHVIRTDDGRYEADAVVLAAGWRTRSLLPGDLEVPIRPYRTQCVVLEPETPLGDSTPTGRIGSEHLYFRPEHNGDLLIGGAHDTIADPRAASTDADESFTLEVAGFAPTFFEGFDDAGLLNGWAGVDTASPDTRPIIDSPVGAPDSLVVATGFNGLGVMTSPVVGPTVRQRLTGEPAPFPAETFAADRFDDVGTDFEYVSTSEV
ncbi:NAD(P)/FAD-dependent oxidoreductase [Halopenitus persicus]|uniref:Glycine/D-amino acid oxidase n=1 Tax=Halopenitus persicus TaxID=1048396 RepID=A0A1H3HDL6_9EURY|nr:FAD-dependent oxidoreductase [Halopenitus persicus]SDY12864.1 Glycine/D-amino acid oxidase [Halopenitus persicus]